MRVTVNGAARELPDDARADTAAALVGVAPGQRGVALALDGEVVPADRWGATPLRDGARVEVVRATAGG